MNIVIKLTVTCDQTGQQTEVVQKDFGPIQLNTALRTLIRRGWSASSYRDANGDYSTYTVSGDGWNLIQDRPDGYRRTVRQGLDRKNLWLTAPDVVPDPPFTKTALMQREMQARYTPPPEANRVQLLEQQVAYLTGQLQRLEGRAAA